MMEHASLKLLHQGMVLLSASGFLLRGILMLGDSALLRRRWMRTWPHAIDTLLLVSGIWMAVNLHLEPGNSPWLTAKIVALLAYIGLGFVALRLGRNKRQRVIALIGALACFAYMVAVAVTRSTIPF
jgi:uncharacterized membrane protein SirB2